MRARQLQTTFAIGPLDRCNDARVERRTAVDRIGKTAQRCCEPSAQGAPDVACGLHRPISAPRCVR